MSLSRDSIFQAAGGQAKARDNTKDAEFRSYQQNSTQLVKQKKINKNGTTYTVALTRILKENGREEWAVESYDGSSAQQKGWVFADKGQAEAYYDQVRDTDSKNYPRHLIQRL